MITIASGRAALYIQKSERRLTEQLDVIGQSILPDSAIVARKPHLAYYTGRN